MLPFEADAIVHHAQQQRLALEFAHDGDLGRARVFGEVGQCLLADAQHVLLDHLGQTVRCAQCLHLEPDVGAVHQLFRAPAQRASEVELFQLARAQVPDGTTQIHLTLPEPASCRVQVILRTGWIALGEFGGGVEVQGDPGQGLLECVVQVPREPGPLGQHGAKLHFVGAPRGHFDLQLRRPFDDLLLQSVVRLLQQPLRLFPLTDQDLEGGVLLGHREQPEHQHQEAQTEQTDPRQQAFGRQPAGTRDQAETGRARQQHLEQGDLARRIDRRRADAVDFDHTANREIGWRVCTGG